MKDSIQFIFVLLKEKIKYISNKIGLILYEEICNTDKSINKNHIIGEIVHIYATSLKEPACQCRRHKTGRKQFLSFFLSFFFFWPCWGACKILVILTRVQNCTPCIGLHVLITGLPGKSWQGVNAYH